MECVSDIYYLKIHHEGLQLLEKVWVKVKVRGCGPTNQIVDNSDFKPSKFDCQLRSESDSKDDIMSTIAISTKFDPLSIKVDQF